MLVCPQFAFATARSFACLKPATYVVTRISPRQTRCENATDQEAFLSVILIEDELPSFVVFLAYSALKKKNPTPHWHHIDFCMCSMNVLVWCSRQHFMIPNVSVPGRIFSVVYFRPRTSLYLSPFSLSIFFAYIKPRLGGLAAISSASEGENGCTKANVFPVELGAGRPIIRNARG